MSQFFAKPPPIVRQPGNLGVSGTHHVPSVSPSINPAAFGEVGPKDKVRKLAVDAMALAMAQSNIACTGSRAIHADVSIPAPERSRRAHALAAGELLKTADSFEKARLANEKEAGELRSVTSGPVLDVSEIRQTEIRSLLAGTKQADRYAKIAKAIGRGNQEIAATVLNADRFFSDFLSDVELSELRKLWAKTNQPDEVARLAVLESDHAYLTRAGEILRSYPAACSGPAIVAPKLAPPGPGHRPVIFGYQH